MKAIKFLIAILFAVGLNNNYAQNTWKRKADFGEVDRTNAVSFSIGNKGYLGTGANTYGVYKDFWEYDPVVNTWLQKADFEGNARFAAISFHIGNKGYIGTGYSDYDGNKKDFWEYTPEGLACLVPTTLSVSNITSSSARLNWNSISGAVGYKVRYKIAGTPEWTIIQSIDNDKTLHDLSPNTEYAWQVKSICGVLPIEASEWSEKQFFTTGDLRLAETTASETMEVYPNPVSQSATVSFFLTDASSVVIELMDVNGRSLKVIADADFSEGNHEAAFNRGSVSAGIYFLQVKTNEEVMMKKMVIE